MRENATQATQREASGTIAKTIPLLFTLTFHPTLPHTKQVHIIKLNIDTTEYQMIIAKNSYFSSPLILVNDDIPLIGGRDSNSHSTLQRHQTTPQIMCKYNDTES